jgi:hypothetical protein
MQGICTYIPETNNVPREYTVAAILLLLFMVPISLVSALALLSYYYYYYYYYYYLQFSTYLESILSSAFPLAVYTVISSKRTTQTRISSSFEVLQHCPKKQREVFCYLYIARGTVMAVWTRNVILFFETDMLKILYCWGSMHTAWEQRHAL